MMKFIHKTLLFIVLVVANNAFAQEKIAQNKPYIDLRKFHFGVFIGTHLQDIELMNVGPQQITNNQGITSEKLISVDQDRWDAGFNVGVLGEFRLNQTFQFRIAPAMYFGTRHFVFKNFTDLNEKGEPTEQRQNLKTVYIAATADLIFAAPRFNNYRPYLMLGASPMINLSGNDDDYIRLKPYDVFLEVGAGCDFYLPYFKLRPEIKFLYGLTNSYDTSHADKMRNQDMRMYAGAIGSAQSKMIVLTFYFE